MASAASRCIGAMKRVHAARSRADVVLFFKTALRVE
jgi:hypothetical protein